MRHPLLIGLALLALSLTAAPRTADADGGIVILSNASNPVSTLSAVDLKKALTGGTKQWSSGAIIQVGLTAPDSREVASLAGAAGLTAPELLSRMQQQVFKGEMRKPVMLRSSAECIGLARTVPGAICAAAAGAALPADVKIIQVH